MAARTTAKARVETLDTTDIDALTSNAPSETDQAREDGTPRNEALAALAGVAKVSDSFADVAPVVDLVRPVETGRTVAAGKGKTYIVLSRWYVVRVQDAVHTAYRGDRLVASDEDAERGLAAGELMEAI